MRFYCGKISQKFFQKTFEFIAERCFPFDDSSQGFHPFEFIAKILQNRVKNFRVKPCLLFDSKVILCRKNFCNNWDSSVVKFRRNFSKIKLSNWTTFFFRYSAFSNLLSQKFYKIKLSNRTNVYYSIRFFVAKIFVTIEILLR